MPIEDRYVTGIKRGDESNGFEPRERKRDRSSLLFDVTFNSD